jgi:hypothetical protein
MDRLEVEVAFGHHCRDVVGARGTDSGCEILEDYRLETRLAAASCASRAGRFQLRCFFIF